MVEPTQGAVPKAASSATAVSRAKGHDEVRLVIQTWLGTRLVMALVAAWLMVSQHRNLADLLSNWDVQHYLTIAEQGYSSPNLIAFFPGWPMLIRLASSVPGSTALAAGTVMALLASGFAAAALYRLYGHQAAIAWLLAPAAVFTMVPYTESLFCAAAFWAWERATSKHWTAAAVLAAVAATVRVSGVFLILALAVLALTQSGRQQDRLARLARLLIPVAAILGYLAYLRLSFGSWTAWYDAQAAGWSRGFTWPWVAFQHTIEAASPGGYADQMGWSMMFRLELITMAVGLVVTVISLFQKRWGEAVWVGSQVAAFSVSYWFMSVNRAALLWFPLWELLGRLGKRKGRGKPPAGRIAAIWVLVIGAVAVQAWWAYQFFTGAWSS